MHVDARVLELEGMTDAGSGTRRQGADGVSRAGTGTVRLQARDVKVTSKGRQGLR